MNLIPHIEHYGTLMLVISGSILLLGGIILSFLTNFVQFRTFGSLMNLLWDALTHRTKPVNDKNLIPPSEALFTAMSTTIGIASIVSPIVAIKLGGPGALLGFILTMIFGSVTTFTEVTFALNYREKRPDGTMMGGPMQYLAKEIHPALAVWYALGAFVLLVAWSANQSNTIADVLQPFGIPEYITGLTLAAFVLLILIGGIKRVGNFSEKIVPLMFFLFIGSALWIIGMHIRELPSILATIITAAFTVKAITSGAAAGGLLHAMRWGLLKGIHTTEAGLGTATIPHSMAHTNNPTQQGVLAMASVWSVGFISLLSGLVVLCTGSYLTPNIGLGINVMIHAFGQHFPAIGPSILIFSTFLFSFGTILGNSYNGSQCFVYLTKNRYINLYYLIVGIAIFVGTQLDIAFIWSLVDFVVVPVAIPHLLSIVYLALKKPALLKV